MGSQKTTLARTPSSLLRSPTLRSSLNEDNPPDEKKTRHSSPKRFFTVFFASPFVLLLFLYFKDEYPFLSSLLFVSALLVLCLILAFRSPFFRFQNRNFRRGDSVEWFIGEEKKASKKIVREGVEFYSNGDVYEGEFHKGRCNGSGVYSFFGHGRYEGDWIDGKYDGFGIESWARGSRYRGQYRRGLRHGFGVYRFFNGDSYAGGWLNGQNHGNGVQSCSDGSCYVGEFKCGVKHGFGCYHLRNGDRYSGEYFADKINGFGVYHFANGHCYEGSWHEGRKQGFGAYVFRNGDARSGEWDCGVLKSPHPASDPSVMHAVHAARKAVENAIIRPRVDDQVNKAVAAANRSATAARVAAVKAVQNQLDGRFSDTDI